MQQFVIHLVRMMVYACLLENVSARKTIGDWGVEKVRLFVIISLHSLLVETSSVYTIIGDCDQPCLNGGRCSSDGVCACAEGWTGSQCEQGEYTISSQTSCHWSTLIHCMSMYCVALCSRGCLNGGTCDAPNHCSCPEGWRGKVCETRKLNFT